MTLTPETIERLVARVRHNQEVGDNRNTFILFDGEHDAMVAALDIANDFLAGRLVRAAVPQTEARPSDTHLLAFVRDVFALPPSVPLDKARAVIIEAGKAWAAKRDAAVSP